MIAALTAAWAHTCAEVPLDELLEVPAPAVFVLGERHGEKTDLRRAHTLVQALARQAPVRVALEALHEEHQSTIDAFAQGAIGRRALRRALDWRESWGYPYRPYKPLLHLAREGVEVVAAGLDLGPKPEGRTIPIPEGYADFLFAAMGAHGHDMPEHVRERFPTSMAWRDFRIAELASAGWDQQGYLVVVTGKGHVEGGRGTNWQLAKQLDVPIHSVILAHEDALCHPGDRVWAE